VLVTRAELDTLQDQIDTYKCALSSQPGSTQIEHLLAVAQHRLSALTKLLDLQQQVCDMLRTSETDAVFCNLLDEAYIGDSPIEPTIKQSLSKIADRLRG
jgi:hypothetical protein